MAVTTESQMPLRAPEPLTWAHELTLFLCGERVLDDWLKHRALRNQDSGASRTFVVCEGQRVVGYYCLATGVVAHTVATGKVRRNMPEPVPVMVLGRLAVALSYQGRGIGRALLADAVLRTLRASELVGVRAILVHAISESAKKFYLANGFAVSPIEPMTLMVTLTDVRAAIRQGES